MALFPSTQFDFPNVSNYDSDLREVLQYWRELKSIYTTLLNAFNELSAEFDSEHAEFEQIKTDFEALSNKVDNLFSTMDAEIAAKVHVEVDSALSVIRAEIANLHAIDEQIISMINSLDESTRVWVIAEIASALMPINKEINEINELIAKLQFELPDILNPAKGFETPLFNVIWDMWDALRYGCVTCGEYHARGLTCGEYDALNMTCLEYDVHSKDYLYPPEVCRNPFTGAIDKICKVISDFASFLSSGLTCGGYDALEMTCGEYDAKELTCYEYDWNGSNLLP